jgi:hypothetical protein
MSTLAERPRTVQAVSARFTFDDGPIIAEGERIRPCGMDEIAHVYGEAALDAIMEQPGAWVDMLAFDAVKGVRHVG